MLGRVLAEAPVSDYLEVEETEAEKRWRRAQLRHIDELLYPLEDLLLNHEGDQFVIVPWNLLSLCREAGVPPPSVRAGEIHAHLMTIQSRYTLATPAEVALEVRQIRSDGNPTMGLWFSW